METQTVPGLFAQLAPLLAHRAVLITVSKLDDGEKLQVNICPRQLKDGENLALTTPLSVTGTPKDLDAELVAQINGFVASHVGLNTNLTAIQVEIAEAEKVAREDAKKRLKNNVTVPRRSSRSSQSRLLNLCPSSPSVCLTSRHLPKFRRTRRVRRRTKSWPSPLQR